MSARMGDMLWFDVEEGYNTTLIDIAYLLFWLWFDVEEGYNTTLSEVPSPNHKLWFDVEEGYNTTYQLFVLLELCCGLISIKDTRRPLL